MSTGIGADTLVIIAKPFGRLGNRIFLFSHFIATAAEYGFRVANPAMGAYGRYFPSCRDLLCRFPESRAVPALGRPGRALLGHATHAAALATAWLPFPLPGTGRIRVSLEQAMDLDSPSFLDALQRHRVLIVEGWYHRSAVNMQKHAALLRQFFTPWPDHLRRVEAVVERARQRGRPLVGLHIRRTDYSTHRGGIYYFSHEQYRSVADRVREALGDVTFLVCSDEPVPPGLFDGLDVFHGNGHELEDMYALAACDRIAGPRSTFTRWASFYGQVPLYEISDPAAAVADEDFEVCTRLGYGMRDLFPPGVALL